MCVRSMRNHDTSLQAQNPVADAGDALAQAEHAVAALQSHPNEIQAQQAASALAQAEHAILSATGDDNEQAVADLLAGCSQAHESFAQAVDQLQSATDR